MRGAKGLSLGLFGGAVLYGCYCGGLISGATIEYRDNFFPEKWPHPSVTLRAGDIEMAAEISMQKEENQRVLKVIREGVVIEEERYTVTRQGIWLDQVWTEQERFVPGIPLLKFPMQVGDAWDWSGKVLIGKRAIESTAKIASRREQVTFAIGPRETVRIEVRLQMFDGSPGPAERRLEFWFAKGEGPIKRDYGSQQIREPRAVGDAKPKRDPPEGEAGR